MTATVLQEGFVVVANLIATRGRPRAFDPDRALATGEALFHERGYEAVGLAALTKAMGIKPPSFYTAFGSKAAFFERVLKRYCASGLSLEAMFLPGRPTIEAIRELLVNAADRYAADPCRRGCLVLEAARSAPDAEAARLARAAAQGRRDTIRAFVARSHPDMAEAVTDMIVATMSGMSAGAREGWDAGRLSGIARIALMGIAAELESAAAA